MPRLSFLQASSYEMRFGTDIDSMYDNFSAQDVVNDDMVVSGDLNAPLPAGFQEMIVVEVPLGGKCEHCVSAVQVRQITT